LTRKRTLLLLAAIVLLAAAIAAVVISRQRVRRHRVFRTTAGEVKPAPPAGIPPIEQWTETFTRLGAADLAELLAQIEARHPAEYGKWSLAYLHARALLEDNEANDAEKKLAPFLAPDHPLRELALYHQSEIHDARDEHAKASAARQELIFKYPKSIHREVAIDEETEYLASLPDTKPLLVFAMRLHPGSSTARRRDTDARLVDALLRGGDAARALQNGFALLNAGTTDDASDRVSRALDRPELIARMTPAQWATIGESFRNHRHFDRAVVLLGKALQSKYDDELQFALGRSHFGAEQFTQAQQVYQRGAAMTKDPRWKATFSWHAARAAQLRGDDKTAERLITASIAVPGKFPATLAAITQRLRTRAAQKRFGEAASDLALLKKLAGNERAFVEGSLAYAVAMVGNGRNTAGVVALNAVPPKLLDRYDASEFDYWRARALEASDPRGAFSAYLRVLRSSMPTHFAYFARQRLDAPAMAPKLAQELQLREAQVAKLTATKQWALAKQLQTDRILLSSSDRQRELQKLAAIYHELPAYKNILQLQPLELPRFPVTKPDRATLLMAMGLYDEATEEIEGRYALTPARQALTRSLALNRGAASRESIYAVEVLMKSVPSDFHPDLLPRTVRELLYPRYFYEFIEEDAKRFEADPTLVLSIMREESRFNPRAKSEAAARGLLQFIITTARDIGRDVGLVDVEPEDLYDPRIIIRLGAKYVATLATQLGGNRYRVAAAYNAGPKQVALWQRMQPAAGDDYFLSAINFDETKHYVRKVMNSWERYRELYGGGAPAGGLRAEP
jgi:soluble lytic murein transglycosylase-like protein